MSEPLETAGSARCPDCGLTETELRAHGLMGCAACYRVFEFVVVQAAAELHGVSTETPAAPSAAARPALPWPTRRAQSHPDPPPFLLDPPAPPEERRPARRRRP